MKVPSLDGSITAPIDTTGGVYIVDHEPFIPVSSFRQDGRLLTDYLQVKQMPDSLNSDSSSSAVSSRNRISSNRNTFLLTEHPCREKQPSIMLNADTLPVKQDMNDNTHHLIIEREQVQNSHKTQEYNNRERNLDFGLFRGNFDD